MSAAVIIIRRDPNTRSVTTTGLELASNLHIFFRVREPRAVKTSTIAAGSGCYAAYLAPFGNFLAVFHHNFVNRICRFIDLVLLSSIVLAREQHKEHAYTAAHV